MGMSTKNKSGIEFPSVLPSARTIEYPANRTIFSQEDRCTDVHYIAMGVVKLMLVSRRGRSGILGFLGAGDFFGEGCISGRASYLTSAIALVPTTVNVVKQKQMIEILEKEPAVCSRFIKYLLARNHRIEEDLIDHLFNSCERRLARTLLLLAQYDRGSTEALVLERITHDTLAEMVGSTRSRVSVFMNKFRRQGFIHYTRADGLKIYRSLSKVLEE
jgi:CRP/FNR family transcriptional regulator, cyclic AMP receptor protein